MSKPKILVQLDTDEQPSVFDSVVAIDAGVDQLLRHPATTTHNVRERVYGAIFTRGPDDLRRTALFVGGSDVSYGEQVLSAITAAFLGPLRTSVMIDSGGANTTAAAAVLAAERHVKLTGATALVLAATGPVGQRVAWLLAREGAKVRAASRRHDRAEKVVASIVEKGVTGEIAACVANTPDELEAALADASVVIACGAAGVELLPAEALAGPGAKSLRVAIDLNAVPPLGIAGIKVTDKAVARGDVTYYGAIGVGGTKMKIHKAAVKALFASNDLVLDAPEIFQIGREL